MTMMRSIFSNSLANTLEGWPHQVKVGDKKFAHLLQKLSISEEELDVLDNRAFRFGKNGDTYPYRTTQFFSMEGDIYRYMKQTMVNMSSCSGSAKALAAYLTLVKFNLVNEFNNSYEGVQ